MAVYACTLFMIKCLIDSKKVTYMLCTCTVNNKYESWMNCRQQICTKDMFYWVLSNIRITSSFRGASSFQIKLSTCNILLKWDQMNASRYGDYWSFMCLKKKTELNCTCVSDSSNSPKTAWWTSVFTGNCYEHSMWSSRYGSTRCHFIPVNILLFNNV